MIKSRLFRILFSVMVTVLSAAVPIESATAHSSVSGTTPSDGETVAISPDEFFMTFNEKVSIPDGFFRIVDSNGTITPLNGVITSPKENGTVAFAALPKDLNGWYALGWKAISSDGHEIEGTVSFVVGEDSSKFASNKEAVAKLQQDPLRVWRTSSTILKSINYSATLLAVGALGFLFCYRRAGRSWQYDNEENKINFSPYETSTNKIIISSAIIGALSAPLALLVNTLLLNGGSFDGIATAFSIQVGTPVGLAQLIRVSAFFALCTAALLIVDAGSKKYGVIIGAIASTALVISYSLSGHASIVPWDTVAPIALVLHLSAGALWLGGIPALAVSLRKSRGNDRISAALIDAFSRVATISIIILFPAAIALSISMFSNPSELFTTEYGVKLLIKFFIVLAIGAIGAYNHFVLLPRLRKESEVRLIGRIRRSIGLESLGLIAVVIATTLLTGQGAPAAGGSHVAHLGASPESKFTPNTSTDVLDINPVVARAVFGNGEVKITVLPARAATKNTMTIEFFDQNGVKELIEGPVSVSIYLPGSDLKPFIRKATKGTNGSWVIETSDFGFAGAWRVDVSGQISVVDNRTGELTIGVKPSL